MEIISVIFLAIAITAQSVASATLDKSNDTDIGSPMELNSFRMLRQSISNTICFSEINARRTQNGKGSVTTHSQVEQAAYNHNSHMLNNNCFSHQCAGEAPLGDRLSATGYRWSGAGEILALGQQDCNQAVQAWMNSEGHRNILLGNSVHVCLTCSNCPNKGPWWTCVFASPL